LAAADLLRFQQGTVAVVDVPQHAIDDVSPQLLVIGIEQFVIDDPGQQAPAAGQRLELVELIQGEDRGLLDEDVLACLQGRPGGLEVAVVGGGDADHIDTVPQEPGNGVGPGEASEVGNTPDGTAAVAFGAGAGAAGNRRQLHFHQ